MSTRTRRSLPPPRAEALLLERLLFPGRPGSSSEVLDLDGVLDRVSRMLPGLAADVRTAEGDLLAELLQLSARRRVDALASRPALLRPEFLRHVRERALDALPQDLDLAEHLVYLAVEQARRISLPDAARTHAAVALCVQASARRLRGSPGDAQHLLDRANLLLGSKEEIAVYLRTLAALRWEQGRFDEARAVLEMIPRLLCRPSTELRRGRLLLGLLHLEQHRPRLAFHALQAARGLDRARQPYPALLRHLGLALAAGLTGDPEAAARHRREAPELSSLPAAPLLSYCAGLEARVALLIGHAQTFERLAAARQDLLDHAQPFAATLATVDLAFFLAETGRASRIPDLLATEPAIAPFLELPPVRAVCEELSPHVEARRGSALAALRRRAAQLPVLLRRACLLRGLRLEPLPFV